MKKIVKVLALAAMLVMSGQAMAQTRGAMFLSASFPMKDFADFDGFDEFALTSVGQDDAGANIGFNVGFKWYFNVGVEGLGVMLSLDGFYNGPNSDLKSAYRSAESSYQGILVEGSFKYNSTPKYINAPGMLGMNYIYHFNPNFGIYVEAGAGANLRFITSMETVEHGQFHIGNASYERVVKNTQKYDMACTFAYQAGVGIEVAQNLILGCSFYDLGKAEVKGEYTSKVTNKDGSTTPTTSTEYKTFGTVRPIMILGRIAFSF